MRSNPAKDGFPTGSFFDNCYLPCTGFPGGGRPGDGPDLFEPDEAFFVTSGPPNLLIKSWTLGYFTSSYSSFFTSGGSSGTADCFEATTAPLVTSGALFDSLPSLENLLSLLMIDFRGLLSGGFTSDA